VSNPSPRGPFLLLPPSEGKADGGRPPRTGARRPGPFDVALEPARDDVRAALGDALRALDKAGDDAAVEKLLGVRGDNLVRARAATVEYLRGDAPVMPAWKRYTGVVWDHLGPLRAPEAKRVLVPSALYGITTAADPIADYRLKLSVVLPGCGKLAGFWKRPLTEALLDHARRRPIVDFLPAEHAAAIDWDALERAAPVLHVRFRSRDGSRAVGHDAKAVKGELARRTLEQGIDALTAFRWRGWRVCARTGEGVVDVLAPG
jgi:cytoplasmic iron level regulating protein YaaA (DUF328/UPF0246 family)